MRLSIIAVLAAGLAPAAWAQTPAPRVPLDGIWRNAHDTVHIEIKPCGAQTCGYVIWANEKAQADARRGGTKQLVGLQLLRDFEPDKDGIERGRVFVPDLNATFAGSAQLADPKTIKAKGCLFGSLVCKTVVWTRLENTSS